MRRIQLPHKYKHFLKATPVSYWLAGGLLFAIGITVGAMVAPKRVTFSYAGTTCVNQWMLAPGWQQQRGESSVALSFEGGFSVGSFKALSTKVCATPTQSFAAGQSSTSVGLGGSWFLAKTFKVTIPEAPAVTADALTAREISAVRPLELTLVGPDTISDYSITAHEKTGQCAATDTTLSCDLASLALDHGKSYELQLLRAAGGVGASVPVATLAVETLTPVVVTKTSAENEQTVYDAVSAFTFSTDKALESAKVTVTKQGESADDQTPVAATTKVDEKTGTVTFSEPLERKVTYRVTISELNGVDGSSLAEPVVTTFTTSGGPKVSTVSVGSTLVAQNARIIISFDQAIDESVNVAEYVKVSGASATVAQQSSKEVAVTLRGAALCSSVTITVNKGMKSGTNGAVADESWSHSARIICGTSSTIGYSVQGRAIVAYYFGSGSSTILFTGGIHGNEPSSTSTMQALVTYLQVNAYTLPSNKRIVIVPNTNPDGIATGTRNNVHNVNVDRNFPTSNWKAKIETASGTLPNGGGTSAGSEPEAKALISLVRQLRPRLSVSFHAQGSLVGANKYSDSVSIGSKYAATVGYGTMFYNAEAVMGYEMTGEFEDWMGEELGIPAILIELPTLSGNYLTGQLAALKQLFAL